MVLAALADNEEELRAAPYKVLQDWQRYYGGNLLIVLPDAFGTAAFLRDAPDWVADWTGFRPDSAPPIEGGEKIIAWWREQGQRPAREAADLLRRARRRHDRGDLPAFPRQGAHGLRLGHQPHQRFRGLRAEPRPTGSNAISLVCKVTEANGRPAVKLSDNPAKATGDRKRDRALPRVFGETDRVEQRSRCEAVAGRRLRSRVAFDAPPTSRPSRSAARQSGARLPAAASALPTATPSPTPPIAAMCCCCRPGYYLVGGAHRGGGELPRAAVLLRPDRSSGCRAARLPLGRDRRRRCGCRSACSPSPSSPCSSPPASSAAAIRCPTRCR